MDIRSERTSDVDTIATVVEAAFGSPAEAGLVAAIRASPNFVPGLSLVAEIDDAIVGHVMISMVTLCDDRDGTERSILSLSPLAVHPDHQGHRIGSALVRAATARADAMGAPLVVLEGDPRYYGRLGFEHSVRYDIHITLPTWAAPEAAQVIRLTSYDPQLRGRVVYPPAFDGVIEA